MGIRPHIVALIALSALGPACIQAQTKKPVTLEALKAPGGRGGRGGGAGEGTWAPDGKTFAFHDGDEIKIYNVASKASHDLISSRILDDNAPKPEPESARFDWTNRRVSGGGLQWSPSGDALLIDVHGNLFWVTTADGKFTQLTSGPTPKQDPKLSPDATRVAYRKGHDLYVTDIPTRQELRLTQNGNPTLLNGELDWVYPEELDLGSAYWWSPDGKSIAYMQFDTSRVPLYPQADLLKTKAVSEPERYPQAGDPNSDVRIGVIPAIGGETHWMDLGDTRDHWLLARTYWAPDSKSLYVVRLARVQNRLDLLKADAKTGLAIDVLRETDPYWINHNDMFHWVNGGSQFIWGSERDGFRHLYLYSADGRESSQITKGKWEVSSIAGIDQATSTIYYVSSEVSPTESHLYKVHFDGTGKQKLTSDAGVHRISMSPVCNEYFDSYSNLTHPPRTTLNKIDGSIWTVYHEADHHQMDEYELLPTEILNFKTSDGTTLYARLIKPKGLDMSKKYPAIVSVYGGPGVQTVRNTWSGVSWEQMMAQKGYVIWQVDNRGSIGRGHAFEAAIYHKMGQRELEDQREGVKHLLSMGFVDPDRVGIQGWSYGGFMTLNAMLNAGDVFKAGISGAPVTNFRNYDTIYTERYMGLPQQNPDGYAGTNLSLKAGNLKGQLLLVDNFEDDNVLFQNMLQATAALQKADRPFELMIYPMKSHGVSGPYRGHLNEMMTSFFDRTLGAGPK
ncbi:MAG TPA: S9 family peptidase [Bryobacteraceae bacterium]|jgi:dipeptidyl-peptidase-4